MTSRLQVNLHALACNYQSCAEALQQLPLTSRCGAVVKADAYGLGAQVVAPLLQAQGCTDFFVASAAEGQLLRMALGPAQATSTTSAIHVFEGVTPATIPTLLAAKLTPVLNSPEQLELWQATRRQNPEARQLPLVLHIDTGMQRLGFTPTDFIRLPLAQVQPDLLLTHLARADEPGHASIATQLGQFVELAQQLDGCAVSVGNSAGSLASQQLREQLLPLTGRQLLGRPGIALYGGAAFATSSGTTSPPTPQLQPVVTLEGQILQIRKVSAGSSVGYGGSYVAGRDLTLAVVGLGYADGLPRLLSNCGEAFVNGQRCDIVGRISMDLTCVDVTDVAEVAVGDWLEFAGTNIPLAQVAVQAQTIDYEILTGIGSRVRRRYHEGQPAI